MVRNFITLNIFFILTALTLGLGISKSAKACEACAEKNSPSNTKATKELESKVNQAIKSGETVLLAFHSSSCATCKVQKPKLKSLLKEKDFKKIKTFLLPYETTKTIRKKLKVVQPSTLVTFNKGKEVARSIGLTNKENLKIFLKKGDS